MSGACDELRNVEAEEDDQTVTVTVLVQPPPPETVCIEVVGGGEATVRLDDPLGVP